jgi:carbon-monoxide dehydrogenase large subunit
MEAAVADITFADGRFTIVGTDRSIDILDLAAARRKKGAAGLDAAGTDVTVRSDNFARSAGCAAAGRDMLYAINSM